MHCLNEQFTALSLFGQFEYTCKIKNNKSNRKETYERAKERDRNKFVQFQFILLKLKLESVGSEVC